MKKKIIYYIKSKKAINTAQCIIQYCSKKYNTMHHSSYRIAIINKDNKFISRLIATKERTTPRETLWNINWNSSDLTDMLV